MARTKKNVDAPAVQALPLARPVEGYNPAAFVEEAEDGSGKFLSLEHKRYWAMLWGAQHQTPVHIETNVEKEENAIPGIPLIRGTAILKIDGEQDRTGYGFVAVYNDGSQPPEYYSSACSIAMSRALRNVLNNAGFTIPGVTEESVSESDAAGGQKPVAPVAPNTTAPIPAPPAPAPDEQKIPVTVGRPPWEHQSGPESSGITVPDTIPEDETAQVQMEELDLESAMAYPITLGEMPAQKRVFDKMKSLVNPLTVGNLLNLPAGTELKLSGPDLVSWLAGKKLRNGRPVQVLAENSRLLAAAKVVSQYVADEAAQSE